MRKYNKPTVEVVNLKSSESIATSFESIQAMYVDQVLNGLTPEGSSKSYAASKYVITSSVLKSVDTAEG